MLTKKVPLYDADALSPGNYVLPATTKCSARTSLITREWSLCAACNDSAHTFIRPKVIIMIRSWMK
jgi:hypothetical protein